MLAVAGGRHNEVFGAAERLLAREAAMQANGQQPLLGQLPTTIEMALLPSTESRVITEPEEPFRILHVNDVWCHVCGYDAEEVIGESGSAAAAATGVRSARASPLSTSKQIESNDRP